MASDNFPGWALSDEIQEAGGSLQVSTGLKGGAEAAIHAMKNIFELETTEAVILVDASNAFNRLNRRVALHNIQYLCPNFSTVLINTYRNPARLFISGGGEILSMEGTTQGDSLAMQFYGISTTNIIKRLDYQITKIHQVWLADDATGAGTLLNLRKWWESVQLVGTKYGYHVKPSKSWLILKDPGKLHDAETLFHNSEIKITTSGMRHLGAAIGTSGFKCDYMEEKVSEWCSRIQRLSKIAQSNPHAAYSAYIIGEQHKYTYFLRTIPDIAHILKPLDDAIDNYLIPSLFGCNITPSEREILTLPIKSGGLGLCMFGESSNDCYKSSAAITSPLKNQIISQSTSLPNVNDVVNSRKSVTAEINDRSKRKFTSIIEKQSELSKRNLEQLSHPGASTWLSAIPLKEQGFNLNKSEFQDALNLRYDKPLKNLPSTCPCGKSFSVTHAMNCHRGGFINARHDSIRNFEAKLLKLTCNDVQVEPSLQPCGSMTFHKSAIVNDEARLDIRAKGFWRQGQNAFFDIRTTNADSSSQISKSIKTILKNHEQEKKRNYNTRVMEIEQGTFTPLVVTTKGVVGHECSRFHKTLASKISMKSDEKYNDIIKLIRTKLSFIVLRSALLCLRGSRVMNSSNVELCDDFSFSINELGINN